MINAPSFTPFYSERLNMFSEHQKNISELITQFLSQKRKRRSLPSPNLEGGFLTVEIETYCRTDIDTILAQLSAEQGCVIRSGTPSELLYFRREVDIFPERVVSMLSRKEHFLYWCTIRTESISFKPWKGKWAHCFQVFVVKEQ